MSDNKKPIGIFDSGVGGLTVWKELVKVLPNESVIYYADNKHCPYGPKSKDEIIKLASNVVDFLIKKQCKIIIVACNTATAAAIDFLRSRYQISFIGMEPAVKPAALKSKTKRIAVLATEGTFNGKLYLETSKKYANDVELNIQVGDKLVEIVEKRLIHEESTKLHLQKMVAPLIQKNIDYLVLGCTHYPFLTHVLKEVLPDNVKIIDPAPAVIKQTHRILSKHNLSSGSNTEPFYHFYISGNSTVFNSILKDITNLPYKVTNL